MTASPSPIRIGLSAPRQRIRFGRELSNGASAPPTLQWLLKRNCSIAPRQLLATFVAISLLTLTIAMVFWLHGAVLVLPFAGAELLAVGAAMLLYARHAADFESIDLRPGRLTVEHTCGSRVRRAEFQPAWVRIEPEHGERSLIELSGQGQRIAVGRYVRPELRRQLADELRSALRRPALATADFEKTSDYTT